MKHIKLCVKEVSEEDRKLTREEYFAVELLKIGHCRASAFLDNLGFIKRGKEFINDYGTAVFRTETTREATPFEYDSWSVLNKHEYYIRLTGSSCFMDEEIESAKKHLSGKEIYPVVVDE